MSLMVTCQDGERGSECPDLWFHPSSIPEDPPLEDSEEAEPIPASEEKEEQERFICVLTLDPFPT